MLLQKYRDKQKDLSAEDWKRLKGKNPEGKNFRNFSEESNVLRRFEDIQKYTPARNYCEIISENIILCD